MHVKTSGETPWIAIKRVKQFPPQNAKGENQGDG
jgi:hypothetical protein